MPQRATPRIAYVLHDLNAWAGQERVTLEVARRLSHRFPVDVHAFTLDDPLGPGAWGELRFRPVRPALRSPQGLRTMLFAAAVAPALRRAQRDGTLVHAAGACTLTSDVVQIHFVHSAWKVARDRLPATMRHAPRARSGGGAMAVAHGWYHEALTRAYMAMERSAFSPGKTYLACSRRIASELAEHFDLRDQVHVVHHGVDPHEFHPAGEADREDRAAVRRAMGVEPDEVLALLVGAYDRKGLTAAIEAMGRLSAGSRRRARLLARGQGNRERFLDQARRAGCADRVILEGITRDISRQYRAADIFLFPTLYEPFGMVIIEAMACGLPVVSSRLAGGSELIEHEQQGLLLDDPTDPDEIAAAWERLLNDDAARRRMGESASRVARARDWDVVAAQHEAILGPLLRERAR